MNMSFLMNCLLRTANRLNGKALAVCALLTLSVLCAHAQKKLSPQVEWTLRQAYAKIKSPEISFQRFAEIHAAAVSRESGEATTLAAQDTYCANVKTYCANGDFETGLDQSAWVGAYGFDYTGVLPNPFTLTYGYSSGALTSSSAYQTIVNSVAGNDPIAPAIPQVAANGGTRALRLGNAITGNGTEVLAKTIVVDASETILNFYYAVVFQDPGHVYNDQPAFSVRAYDCATGAELPNVCNLGNNSNVVVSNAANPFFQSINNSSYGLIAYKNWSLAQINLSAYVGKKVTIIFETKDCNLGGHFGYAYLDNIFSGLCPVGGPVLTGQGSITLNRAGTSTCGTGQICANYTLPSNSAGATGTINISLDIYQAGAKVTTLTSGVLSSGTSYCFNINPASLGLNSALSGFDYALTGNFILSGFSLSPIVVGNPPNGQTAGPNNDYLIQCGGPIYYSKATGDLHNVLTWGLNPDGSGTNPINFDDSTFQLANRPSNVYTMTADWTVNGGTVNIPSGAQLQINGFTFSISQLAGLGTITGSNTSNLTVIGTNGGNIPLSFTAGSNVLNDFMVNRTGTSATATLGNALNILNVLTLTTGTLNTGGLLTLKSTAANTARVAPVTGSIIGNVTVERYIPARRAWRIMSAPVAGTQSINQGWQEGASTASVDPNPGYGTHITQGNSNGFDFNPVDAMFSIKRYVSASGTWTALSNTNATAVNSDAFMLFVRGNRGLMLGYNTVPPSITTLRVNGPLKVGDQTFTVNATGFTAVPNPYASPINFATITKNGVQDNFYLWDPKMGTTGGYVLLSGDGAGNYTIMPASVSPESKFIQSGQGFLVSPSVGGMSGSITIKESDKSATMATDVFRTSGGSSINTPRFADPATEQGLRITLKDAGHSGSDLLLDEVFASYRPAYSDKLDDFDAVKLDNIQENLGMVREGKVLMLERKPIPQDGDVIALKLWNTTPKNYILELNPVNLAATGLLAIVEDRYLKTSNVVSLSEKSQITFIVNANPASARSDRFQITLTKKVPDALTSVLETKTITAYPNPLNDRNINLVFTNKPQGFYQVTLMNSTGQIVFRKNVQHAGGTATQTLQLDKKPVKGVYQLQVSGKDGNSSLSITSN